MRTRLLTAGFLALSALIGLAGHFPSLGISAADRKVSSAAGNAKSKPKLPKPKGEAADAPSEPMKLPDEIVSTGYQGPYSELVSFINSEIRQGWIDNNVAPSVAADDAEWVRRVHLDIVGHIPDLETVQKFLADKGPDKRAKLIDRLLDDDPGHVRNQTTIWTNNLIGRATPRDIDRPALQKFLRDAFGRNRGWHEIVFDLLTAEGASNENGATNFLLAHLNDGAVPATAISARLFLGMQVQCTQCHNHPFNPDFKQNQFWEFNSFFKQARREAIRKYNEKTGRMEVDHLVLSSQDFEGPVYFERRNGVMEVAYPKYNGVEISPDASTNRRLEFAKLIAQGERTPLADAMVNRMWGHFFGFGFTRPVDDMGPHIALSHPALVERLSIEFVRANYDLKQLIRWITNSEAYNLTSRFNGKLNAKDNPQDGEMPLFSHLSLKSMSAEQLYDSLLIATNAHKSGAGNWEEAEAKRQEWMQQFVQTFGTDENDEATAFDGTIPQALMLMNGELIQTALAGARGSVLHQVVNEKNSPADKVKLLYLATLSRAPSAGEIKTANRIMKSAKTPAEAYQDLFWALLNSNEFILIH
jgi:Protein of unknown function (DUF1553)/Protein of unknown function (DUF1549)